jgi:hypothetical protein
MRSSSTRPSSTACAASLAPPIETSLSVASSAAATSSATDLAASRALPWTLSSVRLKTTFGDRAPDVGERGAILAVAHRRIRVPHQHRLVEPAAAQIAAEAADLREMEAKLLLAGNRPPDRALAIGDEAVHRDAHRVDQHGFGGSMISRPPTGWRSMGSLAAMQATRCRR